MPKLYRVEVQWDGSETVMVVADTSADACAVARDVADFDFYASSDAEADAMLGLRAVPKQLRDQYPYGDFEGTCADWFDQPEEELGPPPPDPRQLKIPETE